MGSSLCRLKWTKALSDCWLAFSHISSTWQLFNWHLSFGSCCDLPLSLFLFNLFNTNFLNVLSVYLNRAASPLLIFSSLSLFFFFSVSASRHSFPFRGWPHSAFSISCGCDVSPPQAISSDLSAFFQAIHKNSAGIYRSRLCPSTYYLRSCAPSLLLFLVSAFKNTWRNSCQGICLSCQIKTTFSWSAFSFGSLQEISGSFSSFCLHVHASLSAWGMTCLMVEGSSCALDLVCVVLPCPVIGSRLLAAACAGGLQPGRYVSSMSYVELSKCQAVPTMLPCTAVWQNMPPKPATCASSLHHNSFLKYCA